MPRKTPNSFRSLILPKNWMKRLQSSWTTSSWSSQVRSQLRSESQLQPFSKTWLLRPLTNTLTWVWLSRSSSAERISWKERRVKRESVSVGWIAIIWWAISIPIRHNQEYISSKKKEIRHKKNNESEKKKTRREIEDLWEIYIMKDELIHTRVS